MVPRHGVFGAWEGQSAIAEPGAQADFISGLDPQQDGTALASAGPGPARPLEGAPDEAAHLENDL